MIIETRIPSYAFAILDDDVENDFKTTCEKFAKSMTYNIEYDYYSIYWHEYNWLLAKMYMPAIDNLLTRMP